MSSKATEACRAEILDQIKAHGVISTSALAGQTSINIETLRYHLEEMQKEQLVMKEERQSGRSRRHYWRVCRIRDYTKILTKEW